MADEPTIHDDGESEEPDELEARPALLWQLTSPFALLFSIAFMVIALYHAWPTLVVTENGILVKARVLTAKNVEKRGRRTIKRYREIAYEFNDQKGIPYRGDGEVSYGDKPRAGNTIWVEYKADDPTVSVIVNDNRDYRLFIAHISFASFCLFWRPIVFLLNFVPFLHIKVTKVDYPPEC